LDVSSKYLSLEFEKREKLKKRKDDVIFEHNVNKIFQSLHEGVALMKTHVHSFCVQIST